MVRVLASLVRGEVGVLEEVVSPSASAKRLADMGFIRGAEVQMVHTGNPCVVRVDDGATIGLGRGHQVDIRIRPTAL